jgi:hypothetical protein
VKTFLRIRIMLLPIVLSAGSVVAQQLPRVDQAAAEAAVRIDALSAKLTYRENDPADKARYLRDLPTITEQIQKQRSRSQLEEELRCLLRDRACL